ncbi:hypothetical protein BaRGS_00023399 [Batillaria attramentaria]|uniref:Uncharacterized protein n=1 Tax=Batillaria attramentaria TaxID=370345 RepID=A0ABD0KED4_9CAEN
MTETGTVRSRHNFELTPLVAARFVLVRGRQACAASETIVDCHNGGVLGFNINLPPNSPPSPPRISPFLSTPTTPNPLLHESCPCSSPRAAIRSGSLAALLGDRTAGSFVPPYALPSRSFL